MKITRKLLELTIRSIVKDWMNEVGEKDIQEFVKLGYCADLASAVWHTFDCPPPSILEFKDCDLPVHTWLYFDGLHFDMLSPEGIKIQADMPEFSRFTKVELIDIARQSNVVIRKKWSKSKIQQTLGWR